MTRFRFVLCLTFSLLFETSLAQCDSANRSDVAILANSVLHNVTSPLGWTKRDWERVGEVVLVTAATSVVDGPINQYWSRRNDSILNKINDFGYHYGKPYSALTFSGAFYITGLLIKDDWTRETGIMLASALITSGLVESTLKPLVGRARPENLSGNYDFKPLQGDPKFHSFPSGHAAMAFTISFVLAKRFNNVPLKILFYSFAGATAFCRLYSNAHWFSDIIFSGLSSWVIASESISFLYGKTIRKHRVAHFSVHPNLTGLTFRIAFN